MFFSARMVIMLKCLMRSFSHGQTSKNVKIRTIANTEPASINKEVTSVSVHQIMNLIQRALAVSVKRSFSMFSIQNIKV